MAAGGACAPETVSVRVIETLKGPPRSDWIESYSLIDVTNGPPEEPVEWRGATPAYGAVVGRPSDIFCGGATARRMSVDAAYLVFTDETAHADLQVRRRMTHAFWADARTPFLTEARRLSSAR